MKIPAALLAAASMASAADAGPVLPEAGDFRVQTIRKVQGEENWPFLAQEGFLMCAPSLGQRLVYFVPKGPDGENEYPVALDSNLMSMAVVNMGRGNAFRPYANFEELTNRLSPYITMGKRLCDQPAGTVIPESSL
ncbi:hypothetical protein [uncultured Agrobacterium sp.]|uniref:hypothetical protein n=1 Tax=uncultured Agrobacterium sp. TaxID=157277 RepID=UPI0025EFCD65|nr:hypothetical protein [uncultured Agrobacterium sp.]